ncbi:MAG: hypothetical protein KGK07_16015 [Chloroflexota bacterium]|nr:hypothetical protein [Chloroflexota bacterium]
MAATVKAFCATGAGPTNATCDSADSASITYGRDDNQTSVATLPIPTALGTHFSYMKYLFLDVTVAGATTMSNRRVAWATAPATGLVGYFFDQATYTQNNGTQGTAAANYPADDASKNGGLPGLAPATTINNAGGYAAATTTMTVASGTSFTTGMKVIVGLGTANQEVLTVSSSTATSITFTAGSANSHANGDTIAQAYTALTTSNQLWDNTGVSTAATGKNGAYCQTVLSVDNTFTGGGGAATLPNLNLVYDEA